MNPPTLAEMLTWPAMVDLWPRAGRVYSLSRTSTYTAARDGTFPVPVLSLGRLKKVATADLLRAVGFDPAALLQHEAPVRLAAPGASIDTPREEKTDAVTT